VKLDSNAVARAGRIGGRPGWRRWFDSVQSPLSWLLAGVGIGLRIRQYAFRRSLWNDEASLAVNIISRSYGGLTRKLAIEQGAPIGFLWLEKTATELFGISEYALRLVPLLAGIASVLIFRSLVVRLLATVAANVALCLFAVAPALVYYASESKQYGMDVFAAVALARFLPALLQGPMRWSKSLWWGGTASVLVWCSFPAAFVCGSVSLVVALAMTRRRRWAQLAAFVAGCAMWVASLAVEYFVALRSLHSDPKLLGYWAYAFPRRPLALGSTLSWFNRDLHVLIGFPWHLQFFWLTATLLFLGWIVLLGRRTTAGLFVLVLLAAVAVAAIVHDYPMADRLVLFTVPFVCLLLGAAVMLSSRALIQIGLVALVAIASAGAFASAGSAIVHPYTKTEWREAYVYVQHHEKPGDAVLFEWEGVPDYLYYHQALGVNAVGAFRLSGSSTSCYNALQFTKLAPWPRVWLVLGIDPDSEEGHPVAHYAAAFGHIGRISSVFNAPGPAAAMLLTITPHHNRSLAPLPAPPWQPAPYGCITIQITSFSSTLAAIGRG
jgi:hypothetical protein